VRRTHPQEGSTRKEATECGERDRDGREGCGRRERRKILPCLPTRDRGGPRNRLRLPSARRFWCVCQTCARLFLPRSNLRRSNTVFLRLPESVGYAVASLLSADQSAIGGPPDPVPPCVPRRAPRVDDANGFGQGATPSTRPSSSPLSSMIIDVERKERERERERERDKGATKRRLSSGDVA